MLWLSTPPITLLIYTHKLSYTWTHCILTGTEERSGSDANVSTSGLRVGLAKDYHFALMGPDTHPHRPKSDWSLPCFPCCPLHPIPLTNPNPALPAPTPTLGPIPFFTPPTLLPIMSGSFQMSKLASTVSKLRPSC